MTDPAPSPDPAGMIPSRAAFPIMSESANVLQPRANLARPEPLRVAFPIVLEGDLVLSPEHLGPAYLAAVLRAAGAKVVVRDGAVGETEAMVAELVQFRPHIVGLSITAVSVEAIVRFGTAIRAALGPDVFVLAGGPVATYRGAALLDSPGWQFLDALIRGEGEVPMLRLAEALHTGRDIGDVPSLCFRRDGAVVETPMATVVHDLDCLPDPVRDQFDRHGSRIPYLRLSTSRGCTSHCTFCNAPHARNRVGPAAKPWRGASPKRVVDEIEVLIKRYGVNTFDFVDSTFEDPGGGRIGKGRVAAICEEIVRRDLRIYFNACMQAAHWNEDDRPLLDLLWRAGLEKVLIGVESGSEQGLARWQKKASTDDNRRAIRILRETGVYVAFGFIAFHPWSTFAEIRQNAAFLRDMLGHNLRRFTTRLELYPGAEVVDDLERDGLLDQSFFQNLNPFSYRYADPRVERLATALNGIYGAEYANSCKIHVEPAVFRFETDDIVLHNFSSRLRRAYGHDAAVAETLDEFAAIVEALKEEMAGFNYELVSELVDMAEREADVAERAAEMAVPIEMFFSERIRAVEAAKLRTGMRLRRQGFDVSAIHKVLPRA